MFFFSNQKQPIDLERKPLLYDYYANTLNPIYDKRTVEEADRPNDIKRSQFDQIDRYAMPFYMNKRSELKNTEHESGDRLSKRNFDEIDRFAMPMLHFKQPKRNFDEIDAFAMPLKLAHARKMNQIAKRPYHSTTFDANYPSNTPDFNEIDRSSYTDFVKRYMDEDRASSAVVSKRNFDEIDRFAMPHLFLQNSLKRKNGAGNMVKKSVRHPADSSPIEKRDVRQVQTLERSTPAADDATISQKS